MTARDISANPKIAAVAAVATTASAGISTYLEWIPEEIGRVATLAACMLSLVLIYVHLRRGHAEIRKTNLETEILQKMQSDISANAEKTELFEKGYLCGRCSDSSPKKQK